MLLVLLPHNPALLAHISPAHSDTATQEDRELLLKNIDLDLNIFVCLSNYHKKSSSERLEDILKKNRKSCQYCAFKTVENK